jgi:hypothetical protein
LDAADGQTEHTIQAHEGDLSGIRFLPGGDLMATAGTDGMLRLWAGADARPLGTFAALEGTEQFITWVPEGPLLASEEAFQEVSLCVGMQPYPLQHYRELLQQPGLVERKLSGKSIVGLLDHEDFRDAAIREGGEMIAVGPPPEVKIVQPEQDAVAEQQVQVVVQAGSDLLRILSVQLRVNGSLPVKRPVMEREGGSVRATYTVELQPGKNTLKATTVDTMGVWGVPATRDLTLQAE